MLGMAFLKSLINEHGNANLPAIVRPDGSGALVGAGNGQSSFCRSEVAPRKVL